jgi:hypothetical protein
MGCDIHMYFERKLDNGSWTNIPSDEEYGGYYVCRNYILFGYLAGVRNYNVKPIADQRGIPKDVSKTIYEIYFDFGSDAHSASYLTIEELLAAEKSKVIFRRLCGIETYKKYLEDPFCFDYPDVYNYYNIKIISNSEMDKIIKLTAFLDKEYYTYVEYDAKLSFNPPEIDLWSKIIPKILKVESYPKKLRAVFWFDN